MEDNSVFIIIELQASSSQGCLGFGGTPLKLEVHGQCLEEVPVFCHLVRTTTSVAVRGLV